jgi:hypothetical protein
LLENLSIQSFTNVAAGGPPLAHVSDIYVPQDLAVPGGAEKKKRAPPGTNSSTKTPDPDFISLDLTTTPPISSHTKSKKTTGTNV